MEPLPTVLSKVVSKSKNAQVIFNLVKCCLGSGVLGLPIVFAETGIVESILLTILIAYWTYCCSMKIIKANNLRKPKNDDYVTHSDYSECCYQSFGKIGVYIFEASTTISLLGVGVVYTLTAEGMLSRLPWSKIGIPYFEHNRLMMILIIVIVLIPVNLLRDMTSLSWASMLGNACIIICLFIVLMYNIFYFFYNYSYGFCTVDLSLIFSNIPWMTSSISGFSRLFGTIIYAYSIVLVTLPTVAEMEQPHQYSLMAIISLLLSSFFYIIFTSILVMLFTNDGGVKNNILYNINEDSIWYYISTLMISVMAIFSFPVAVMPALQLIEPKSVHKDKGLFTVTPLKILFRISITIGVAAVAYLFPNFNIVISLLGNIIFALVNFIIPPLLLIKMNNENMDLLDRCVNYVLVILGVVAAVYTTVTTITTM